MIDHTVLLVLLGWAVAGGSPGPATLAISGTAMDLGRAAAGAVAAGIVCASAAWGIAAALGMSTVMMTHAWLFEFLRYAGAAYLLFLALKSLRSGLRAGVVLAAPAAPVAHRRLFVKGLLLHVTNPKAILAWGSVYAIALPAAAEARDVWQLFGLLICTSMVVFFGYALLFSRAAVSRRYRAMRRGFDLTFAALFGAASLRILTARIGP